MCCCFCIAVTSEQKRYNDNSSIPQRRVYQIVGKGRKSFPRTTKRSDSPSWLLADGKTLIFGVGDDAALQVIHRLLKGGLAIYSHAQLISHLRVDVILERTPLEARIYITRCRTENLIHLLPTIEGGGGIDETRIFEDALECREYKLLLREHFSGLLVMIQPHSALGGLFWIVTLPCHILCLSPRIGA